MLLASRTRRPVFKSMFYVGLKERGDVRITDATAEGFAEMKFTIENIVEVMRLIDKYVVSDCFMPVQLSLRSSVTAKFMCTFCEWTSSDF